MSPVLQNEPVPLKVDQDGVIRVGGTRVTLDTVIGAYLDGATADEIVEQFPVSLADIYATISYYLRHRPELDAYLQKNEREALEFRAENERRFSPKGVRERLLSRR